MKEKLKLRSSFQTGNKEELQKAVTQKIEKLVNTKMKKAS